MKETNKTKNIARRKPRTRSGELHPSILNPQSSILTQSSLLSTPSNRRHGFVWAISVLYFFYIMLLQVSPGVIQQKLARDFGIDATNIGSLVGLYFYIYAGMQIPFGIMLDRFKTKYILSFAALSSCLGCLLFAYSSSVLMLYISLIIIAIGSAMGPLGAINIAAKWFNPRHFSLLFGTQLAIGMLGAVSGEAPFSYMVSIMGWRFSMIIFAFCAAIFTLLFFVLTKDSKTSSAPNDQKTALITGLKFALTSKPIWLASLFAGLMYAPTMLLGSLWGVPFFQHRTPFEPTVIAFIVSFIYIGWIFGAPGFGLIYEKYPRYKTLSLIAAVLALISILGGLYFPAVSKTFFITMLFIFGVASSGMLLSFTYIREITPIQYNGSVMGFANMFNMLIGATATPFVGIILDHLWSGKIIHNMRDYSISNYSIALSIIPLMFIAAIIILLLLKKRVED